ncbi:hypothetical protein MRF4_01905 [Methylobacterium radiotolerans]|uniref:Uncharacterized protein n=1 Tax=Methylobacterium oryzae TaxID=334852 RepID=A0ABU7TI93_9HYPH
MQGLRTLTQGHSAQTGEVWLTRHAGGPVPRRQGGAAAIPRPFGRTGARAIEARDVLRSSLVSAIAARLREDGCPQAR